MKNPSRKELIQSLTAMNIPFKPNMSKTELDRLLFAGSGADEILTEDKNKIESAPPPPISDGKTSYIATSNIRLRDVMYRPGDVIELTNDEFKRYKSLDAIKEIA